MPRTVGRVNHPNNEWLFSEAWGVDVNVSTPRIMSALVEEAVTIGDVVRLFTFRRGNGSAAMAYWNDVPLLTSSYDGTVSFKIYDAPEGAVRLLDLAAGTAYTLPPEMTECDGHGELLLKNIPLSDTPLLLTFGEFAPALTEEI